MFKFLIVSLLFSKAYSADLHQMKCIYTKGKVSVIHEGISKTLLKNDILNVGDSVITDANSLAVVKLPTETIKVNESSSFKLAESNAINDVLVLDLGAIIVHKLKKKLIDSLNETEQVKNKKASLIIKTHSASIGVRGTTFFAYSGKNDQTVLSVDEGVVAFKGSSSEQEVMVNENNSTMTNEDNKNLEARKFGFEDKINYALDPNEKLECKSDLYVSIENTWQKYKKEQEAAWKKQVDSETDKWERWKNKNGDQ